MTHCHNNHHIIGHWEFVLVSTELVMMYYPANDNSGSCKICTINDFILRTWVLWNSIMNYAWFMAKIKEWFKMFEDRHRNKCSQWGTQADVHYEEWNGWPSTVSNDNVHGERVFHNLTTSVWMPQISWTVLCKTSTIRLGLPKFLTTLAPKMLIIYTTKMHKMASALAFSEQHQKKGDEFLSNII
jgi:hypothetical protein